jgi:hypothetical protein
MDERDKFLRTWYRVLWSNIDRSMTSIWQIVGPIALVGAAFIYMDKLGPHLAVSLQFLIIFWALNNTMDMNSWHRRNLIFVSRVERHFLQNADYGVLIPSSFREPRTDWIEFYSINATTFVLLLGIVIAIYVVTIVRAVPVPLCITLGPAAVLIFGGISTIYTYRRCERQIIRYFRETQGAPPLQS